MNKFTYGKQFNKLNKKISFNVTYTNFWKKNFLSQTQRTIDQLKTES